MFALSFSTPTQTVRCGGRGFNFLDFWSLIQRCNSFIKMKCIYIIKILVNCYFCRCFSPFMRSVYIFVLKGRVVPKIWQYFTLLFVSLVIFYGNLSDVGFFSASSIYIYIITLMAYFWIASSRNAVNYTDSSKQRSCVWFCTE